MSNESILISGGGGTLGSFFANYFPNQTIPLNHYELDVSNIKSIELAIKKYKPHYLLNCASLTDMNYCEDHEYESFSVNMYGVANVKKVTQRHGIKLIHISTDAAINPISVYGKSKKRGDSYINKEDLLIYTTYYSSESYLIKNLLKRKKVLSYTNVFFKPISILTLAQFIFEFRNNVGRLNLFSQKNISKYDFACRVAQILGISTSFIQPIMYLANSPNQTPRKLKTHVTSSITIDLDQDIKKYIHYLKLK